MVIGSTGVRSKASVVLLAMLGAAIPAQAGFIINITQVGGDVVITESGSINSLAGLTFQGPTNAKGLVEGAAGIVVVGSTTTSVDTYYSGLSGLRFSARVPRL